MPMRRGRLTSSGYEWPCWLPSPMPAPAHRTLRAGWRPRQRVICVPHRSRCAVDSRSSGMPRDRPPAVHALLRVSDLDALVWEARRPDWARTQLQHAPWVVVRRSAHRSGLWPVGVRGALRAQRCAAWLPDRAVDDRVTPQLLASRRAWRQHWGNEAHPPIVVLEEVALILAAHGHDGRWGPCGSVGFELATGLPCTTRDSDLDLVLQAERAIAREGAGTLP